MNELENLIKSNRDSFDRKIPRNMEWNPKTSKVKPFTNLKRKSPFKWFLQIAAVLALILSIVLMKSNFGKEEVFANVIMTAPDGRNIALDPSKNKYTLVQFWESGNVVCSDDNCYYYLPAYEKYKELGFEIYAISLDEDHEAWLKGIEENKLPWIHVSDLKGWESPLCVECNISKVPTSFLLNSKGEIIESDLDAEKLEKTLDELLAEN